jgi:hypothetical protein
VLTWHPVCVVVVYAAVATDVDAATDAASQDCCGPIVVWWKGGGYGRNKRKGEQRDELKINIVT